MLEVDGTEQFVFELMDNEQALTIMAAAGGKDAQKALKTLAAERATNKKVEKLSWVEDFGISPRTVVSAIGKPETAKQVLDYWVAFGRTIGRTTEEARKLAVRAVRYVSAHPLLEIGSIEEREYALAAARKLAETMGVLSEKDSILIDRHAEQLWRSNRNPRPRRPGVAWTSPQLHTELATTLYPTKAAADAVAAKLREDEEDWTYLVAQESRGWRIEIYDEDGHKIANYSAPHRNPRRLVQNPYKDKILLPSGNIQYVYGEEDVAKRQREKAQRIEGFKAREEALLRAVKRDVAKGDDTALAIGLIMATYERPGNAESARDGHYGVTGWECRHLSKEGKSAVALDYVGKSGVQQHKVVSDPALVRALLARQRACKRRGERLLDTSPSSINRYLADYGVRAKDLRTFGANVEMQAELTRLRKAGPRLSSLKPRDLKRTLKAEFMAAVATVAGKMGHTTTMLRRQYLVKEMEPTYVATGRVVKSFA